jgi:hypothetical protein
MTAPLRGRGEFFVVCVRQKQDEIEMEAGGLGPEGPGACLERRSGAPRRDPCAPESQCVYKTRCYWILSVLSLHEIYSNKPRYHKNSRAYKVPQFLERQHAATEPHCSRGVQPGGICVHAVAARAGPRGAGVGLALRPHALLFHIVTHNLSCNFHAGISRLLIGLIIGLTRRIACR